MPIPIPFIIIAVLVSEALHLWLGWPLWAGVVIVCVFATGPAVLRALSLSSFSLSFRLATSLKLIVGTVIAAILVYIPMALVSSSW